MSSFPSRNRSIIVTVATSPFTVIQGPRSCISSTVSISPFESSARTPLIFASFTSAISDCVFTVLLLVFSIRLQGKPSWRGQSSCCLVDNQRSSGVAVARIRIVTDSKPARQRRVLHQSIYPSTSRKIGQRLSSGIRFLGCP